MLLWASKAPAPMAEASDERGKAACSVEAGCSGASGRSRAETRVGRVSQSRAFGAGKAAGAEDTEQGCFAGTCRSQGQSREMAFS